MKNQLTRERWLRNSFLLGSWLLFVFSPFRSAGLDPAKELSQYNAHTWTRHNGLPVTGINAITQGKKGYLWLGSSAGLVRFDGVEFKLFDLSQDSQLRNSAVASLTSARNGGLWVGLEQSAFGFFDGRSFSFRGNEASGKLDMDVKTILENKDGTLWIIEQSQLARLTKAGSYEELLSSEAGMNILCGYQDSLERIWLGTDRKGLHFWENGKLTKVPDNRLDASIILSVVEDRDGQIWIGTSIGLHCLDAKLQRKAIPFLVEQIPALLVDRHGILWIGTTGRGLVRFKNGTYTSFRKVDGLADDNVRTLAEDREGSLWIGTQSGLSQLTDVKFPTHSIGQDPSMHEVLAVAASRRGGIWIASSGGATYFDGKSKTYGTESGLTNPYIKRVFEASTVALYLVSGLTNLIVFSQGKPIATHSATNMLVGIAEDEQGVVVSSGGSLYRVGTNYFTPYAFTNAQEPPLYWILNLASGRDGSIWAASVNGICRIKDGAFQHWTVEQGLSDQRVDWICEDSDGVVWAAMMTGIARLKNGQIRCISRDDGLFDNRIYAIVPDELGNLWVDSGRGVFRVSRNSMNDFADGNSDHVECVSYEGSESVKPTDKTVQERSGCKTLDGRIWFPTPKGVLVIDPANIPTNQVVPPVHIDRVRANGNELTVKGRPVVPPGKGELEFHFTAPSFIAPEKVRFRYRLVGYDKDWVETRERRIAFYTNLKPGQYTFRIIAANADGVWNYVGDSLALEFLPHYYQTAWFYTLGGILGFGALARAYGWRVRHLTRKQGELVKARDFLEARVKERTANLAEANASLKSEIEERKRMEQEVERVHRQLVDASRQAGMAEIATGVLHNVGNVLNSVTVSASLVVEELKKSKVSRLAKAVALMQEHAADLGAFITSDPKGKLLPDYLNQITGHLATDQSNHLKELDLLRKNIEHIEEIVAMQLTYAKVSRITETIKVTDLVEDALRINAEALLRHGVQVVREYDAHLSEVTVDKHKVLQILINLIQNAKDACGASGRKDKGVRVRVSNHPDSVSIAVIDNGDGIPAENLTRIFNHGFTTRKEGHGFGLHSSALAAKEIGGSISARSDGPGLGATFIVALPLRKTKVP